MTAVLIELSDEDKLRTLQRLDRFREWHSLDERRYCLVCSHLIRGRDIQVTGDNSDASPIQAICPTPHCHSIPMDWVLPTEEILATLSSHRGNLPHAQG